MKPTTPRALTHDDDTREYPPVETWRLLLDGNRRWAMGEALHPNCSPQRMAETALAGQHPVAAILACSDSRMPVELLFDVGVGDLFTIRVAGNVAHADEIASLEFAVDKLRVPLLLVLGHTDCGAVGAVCEQLELRGSMPELVTQMNEAVEQERACLSEAIDPQAFVDQCVAANVLRSMQSIIEGSAEIRSRVRKGELLLLGAIYELATGRVQRLGKHPRQDEFLGQG
jgi:carbonic anhydrase